MENLEEPAWYKGEAVNIIVNEEIMEDTDCSHEWKVTVDENNFPEDVMCRKCKEVVIMVDMEDEQTEPF